MLGPAWGPAAGHPAGILGTGRVGSLAKDDELRPAGPARSLANVTPPGLAPDGWLSHETLTSTTLSSERLPEVRGLLGEPNG